MNAPQPLSQRSVVSGMQKMTPSEAFVETLVAQGVDTMFGIMGSAFMDAMDIFAPAGIRLIPVVHEQGAGHMADGYSRASGRHGVVIGQNGPGISNCVTAIAAAYWAHSPVVMITPETGTMGIGLGGFQEANQLPMFQEFTKYQGHVNNNKRMAEYTARCFDRAHSELGPTQLNIPRDLFYGEITCEIPKPMRLDRGPGGEASLQGRGRADRQGQVPGADLRRRRGHGRGLGRMHRAGRAPGLPGGQQLPAQRQLPGQPCAMVRPAGLPGQQGRHEADVAGRRGDRAGLAPRALRHAAAVRHGLLAEERQDRADRRRPQDARPGEEDRRRHLRRRQGRRRRAAGAAEHSARWTAMPRAPSAPRRSPKRRPRGRRSWTAGRTSATPTAWT